MSSAADPSEVQIDPNDEPDWLTHVNVTVVENGDQSETHEVQAEELVVKSIEYLSEHPEFAIWAGGKLIKKVKDWTDDDDGSSSEFIEIPASPPPGGNETRTA